jgi:Arc/MetJ family transcription regulator
MSTRSVPIDDLLTATCTLLATIGDSAAVQKALASLVPEYRMAVAV